MRTNAQIGLRQADHVRTQAQPTADLTRGDTDDPLAVAAAFTNADTDDYAGQWTQTKKGASGNHKTPDRTCSSSDSTEPANPT